MPYGSAYGVENIVAQQALEKAAIIALDEAISAFGEFHGAYRGSHGDTRRVLQANQSQSVAGLEDARPLPVTGRGAQEAQ